MEAVKPSPYAMVHTEMTTAGTLATEEAEPLRCGQIRSLDEIDNQEDERQGYAGDEEAMYEVQANEEESPEHQI